LLQKKPLTMLKKKMRQRLEDLKKKHKNKRLQMNRLDMKNLWLRRQKHLQRVKKKLKPPKREERRLKNVLDKLKNKDKRSQIKKENLKKGK